MPAQPRGEKVLPGVFRLRLPLPWPGVPHCNAWAVADGDGFVLFDTGMHQPDSMANLERALAMCSLRLEDARLIVCTHAHSDHCGQAPTIAQRAGCEVWMHPNHEHLTRMVEDPDAVFDRRVEVARQSGVPEEPLRRYASERSSRGTGIAGPIEPDRDLLAGVSVGTDLGEWVAYETPGHAPSHVCLFQPERRVLISGDHLLGRISLYFDYGYSPDPVGEFLSSLDVVERLDARLCLAGHGRTFTDVQAHIQGNRTLIQERLASVLDAVGDEQLTAFEIVPHVYGTALSTDNAHWLLSKILGYLTHLEALGDVRRIPGEPERWTG
jgi:glyoxylase-like metal-dependent hydrolase (beta-lactamase superfamily II)